MIGYVYMLTSPSGKKYIGRTIDFKRRMRQYQAKSRSSDSPIYKEVNRYGFDNFKSEILKTIDGERDFVERELNRLEREYIEKYDTVRNGLNQCRWDSNTREIKFSDEIKKKMRKSQTGRKHSAESRKKRSGENAYQGKKVYSKTLEKTFPTLREAAHYSGITNGCKISECIKGKRKSAGTDPKTGKKITDWKYV